MNGRNALAGMLGLWAALTVGCSSSAPRLMGRPDGMAASVKETVDGRVRQIREDKDGRSRWSDLRRTAFQSADEIAEYRSVGPHIAERIAATRIMLERGPLGLRDCMIACLEFNDTVQKRRAEILEVGGDALVARSRFLPKLSYLLDDDTVKPEHEDREHDSESIFRLSQTILEFGKDNEQDVTLRQSERVALFNYENAVRAALFDVRRIFFTILLRQQQLGERQELLKEFLERYRQIQALKEAQRVLEVDVLTARLNVLNEETRINSLEKEILRKKIDLLHLMGLPVGVPAFQIEGNVDRFAMPLEEAVDLGLRRSTAAIEARADLVEEERALKQLWWRYAPDVTVTGLIKGKQSAGGLELSGSGGEFALGAFGEARPDVTGDGFTTADGMLEATEEGWYVGVEVELPIFDGLERHGEMLSKRAEVLQARHELRDAVETAELDIRKAYQTLLERRKELEIFRERVKISRERLRVQERLKELGRVSDNELETFRTAFFSDQDTYFRQQISLVEAQERLRAVVGYFEEAVEAVEDGE